MNNRQPLGIRMAFREEGEFLNCYLARTGTLRGAEFLGSMRRDFLDANPKVLEAWQASMKHVLVKIGSMMKPGATLVVDECEPPATEIAGRA